MSFFTREISMTMRGITLEKVGGCEGFRLISLPIPEPKKGEIRIQVKAAGFNPVDTRIRRGEYGDSTPLILGADCSGIVDAVGEDAGEFKVGDEVYAMPFRQGMNGSYAEYLTLPHQFAAKKPKHLSFLEAASLPLASLTAFRATSFLASLHKNQSIFIAGAAGGVGAIAVQMIRHFYGDDIFTVAGSSDTVSFLEEKLHIEKKRIINYKSLSQEELQKRILEANQNQPFLATFDFVGKHMKTLATELTDYSGHIVSIVPESPTYELSTWTTGSPYFRKNLISHPIFVGAESHSNDPSRWQIYKNHLKEITQLINEKKIVVPLCTSVGPLSVETVTKAHELLESSRVKGKLVMTIDFSQERS